MKIFFGDKEDNDKILKMQFSQYEIKECACALCSHIINHVASCSIFYVLHPDPTF